MSLPASHYQEYSIAMTCQAKNFYDHSPHSKYRNWSVYDDQKAEEERVKEQGKAFVVIHRHSKSGSGWVTHSIEAQSSRLRQVLDHAFQDYPDWYPDATPYSLAPPFKPYVHRWDQITKYVETQDQRTKDEFATLSDVLKPHLKGYLDFLANFMKTHTVSFNLLWVIFAPGSLIFSNEGGQPCISRLQRMSLENEGRYEPPYWVLVLEQIDWDGFSTGFTTFTKKIPTFPNIISAARLPACPLDLVHRSTEIRARMLDRGRKFERLRGFSVRACETRKYTHDKDYNGQWKVTEKPISGRVVVDTWGYGKYMRELVPEIGNTTTTTTTGQKQKNERMKGNPPGMTDLECTLAVPRVRGFDLTKKEWCQFNVDDIIEDPQWDETPIQKLVLASGDKELIMAFAEQSQAEAREFDDFVKQKGQGIIILLGGPPGVGKTLTAEAAAEKVRAPLYILSAGNIGTEADEAEKALDLAFDCCRMWNAVILLDEADVFMEKRDTNGLARNELVSVFLRKLEYFSGLMFLTTNRTANLDPAVRSRMDLILPYGNLDRDARLAVWKSFVNKQAPNAQISDEQFSRLAKTKINGREIKNMVKTALVLSNRENDGVLRKRHLDIVASVRKRMAHMEAEEERLGRGGRPRSPRRLRYRAWKVPKPIRQRRRGTNATVKQAKK